MSERIAAALLNLDPGSELEALVQRCEDIEAWRYRDGEFLIREEEVSEHIFVVVQGGFVVEQVATSPPTILACVLVEAGQPAIVGEMAYLGQQVRSASVRCSGGTFVLRLAPHHVDHIIEVCPGLTRTICQQFAQRLRQADGQLRDFQQRFALEPRQRMAAEGEVLFRTGELPTELHQMVAGLLRLEGPQGVRDLGPEELPQGFVELRDFLAGTPHTCTATLLTPSFLITVPALHRTEVVRCYPDLVLDLLR